ncbi:SAV_2336 N-terminal domain-related protein [Streptomyces sp. DH41]|uniref:SAV_2336 N-terminal domain-related protein n=1 Tax=Streptomyces sp. DH41 TaxID=3040125 RepID=UPI0024414B77|nr:SAV_2336 N-terminal domain-related protein [Streptomyces sp. DH41]MDG9721259.1 SAV_2336 N-terminal domain-related protein [Streptomyces sp. DH41]
MASDPDGAPQAGTPPDDAPQVGRLRAALAAAAGPDAGGDVTPRELAELLWLAARLAPGAGVPTGQEGAGLRSGHRPGGEPGDLPPGAGACDEPPPATDPDPPPHDPPPTLPVKARVPLHLPEPSPVPAAADGTPLLAPAPPMLHHTLALQRALRPLQRKVPDSRARVLDERATADRIARLGAHPDVWLPVLRPAPDRWLRLNLVHDVGPTMPVWRPLARELHVVLSQSGIFRAVTARRATPDGHARGVPVLADGRTVTLIVSDCMGPQWRPGPAGDRWYRTLRRWAGRMPVAVVQPLPEHLWDTTALPAFAGLLTPPAAAAPSATLTFTPYVPDTMERPLSAVPLPVLEPGPAWLANWAELIADPGAGRVPGAVAWLPPAPVPSAQPPRNVAALSPEELVLRFRSTASPEAYRLAGHLSLAVPSLPVMRLVQRALERAPRPQHLAEIVLSGLLTTVLGPPGSYAFRPGVRDLLLRSLPRTERGRTRELLDRVGALIDERAGLAAGEFQAEARRGADDTSGTAFATVAEETVRRLGGDRAAGRLVGGRYRLLGQRNSGRRVWEAVDERTDRPVAVHLYPEQTSPERFTREARTLAELDDPHVTRVLDHGLEGERPYLVTEFLDGVTLRELEDGSGPGVSFGVFARLATQTTAGLQALHARGLVRGRRDADGLLLLRDGTVVISRFALGWEAAGKDAAQDLVELGRLVQRLARNVPTPAKYEELVREIEHSPASGVSRSAVAELARVSWPRRMRIQLLGRPAVRRDDGTTVPIPPEVEALFCMLVLRHGQRVPFEELVEGLWETRPPGFPADRIRVLATELRALLGPGTLAALPDGYALHTPDDYIDVSFCEDVLRRPRYDPGRRARRRAIRNALDLWYGEPLERVPGPAARAARARLEDLRLTLYAAHAELDLELGDADRTLDDLGRLVREHPDREDLRRLHIMALRDSGRTAEAVESYEIHAEHRRRQGEPVGPALQELYRALLTAPERQRPTIVFEAASPLDEEARRVLGLAVTRLLERSALAGHEYEVLTRGNGHIVLTEPDTDVQPVLADVLRALPDALAGLRHPPRLRVTFWHASWFADARRPVEPPGVRAALDGTAGEVVVVVSPVLYEEFAGGPAAAQAARFLPLRSHAADEPPLAWYCPLRLPAAPSPRAAAVVERDLVRGPFTASAPSLVPAPVPHRTAVVLLPSDGPTTLLTPEERRLLPADRPATYYEVDLTTYRFTRQASLPSSGGGVFAASVELSWHVDDPVAFVDGETVHVLDRLLGHLLEKAPRLTRRHPLPKARAAQREVGEGLAPWPVPGLSVWCSVRLAPSATETGPRRPEPGEDRARLWSGADKTLLGVLRTADAVLLGFEGPLATLFSGAAARRATRELLSLVAEERTPEDSLAGRPLTASGGPIDPAQARARPLDVLRAFAHDTRLGPLLRERLDRLELEAAANAGQTTYATSLVATLQASRFNFAYRVFTDVSEQAVRRHLERHALSGAVGHVHGRGPDLATLMPDPDCLRRALDSLYTPARAAVVIGSSATELGAARELGLPFIGYAGTLADADHLRAAGCDVLVRSLMSLVDAVNALTG